jgi:hypothetical protein
MGDERRIDSRYTYEDWKEDILYEIEGQHRIFRFHKVDISPHGLGGYLVGKFPDLSLPDFYIFKKGVGMVQYKIAWFVEESIESFRFGLRLLDSRLPSYCYGIEPKRFTRVKVSKNKTNNLDIELVY